MGNDANKIAKVILELIEDKNNPGKRLIFDYVVTLVAEYNYADSKRLEQMGIEFFKVKDA